MSVRDEVRRFVDGGPLPSEEAAVEDIARRQSELQAISPPVTNEEAKLLLSAFGEDESYGLAWTLLHRIETAPDSPLESRPPDGANRWVKLLWDRAQS